MKQKLPKSWKDITLSQYAAIYDLTQEQPDPNNSFWELEQQCHLLSEITGIPYQTLYASTPVSEVKRLYKKVSFISAPPKSDPVQVFKMGGYKWHVQHDITKLSASAYIDLTEYSKEPHNLVQNAHNVLALFCTPYKFNWLKLKWQKVEMDAKVKGELLQSCPVSVAYPLTVFFCNLWNDLIKDMVPYLNTIYQTMKTEADELMTEQAASMNSAGGSSRSIISRDTTERNGITS
jgi:hypothetical protein